MREILEETPTVSVLAPTWPGRVDYFSIGGTAATSARSFPYPAGAALHGFAEQEALSRIAGLLAQVADLHRVFEAFGDQRKPRTLRHSDNGVGQTRAKPRLIMGLNILDKGAVNF